MRRVEMEQGPYRKANVDFSHAVRSIRMAAALNERYGAVIRSRTYRDALELSNVVGEACQLYPEIWTLLDDARRELAGRGVDTSAYDAVRASPAARAPAVLDMTEARWTGFAAHITGGERTATLNGGGHQAAIQACALLRAAMPQIDWEGLERAEAAALGNIDLGPPLWKKAVFYTIAGVVAALAIAGYIYSRLGMHGDL
jgi:hypothetical protein